MYISSSLTLKRKDFSVLLGTETGPEILIRWERKKKHLALGMSVMSQEIVLQWISGVAVPCLPPPFLFLFDVQIKFGPATR